MNIIYYPDRKDWPALLARPKMKGADIDPVVSSILTAVKKEGDTALLRFAKELDGADLDRLTVSREEMDAAESSLEPDLRESIEAAFENIRTFHEAQTFGGIDLTTSPGVRCVQRSVPIRSVGLYVPGGTAPLFSTVLMLAVPATIAGVSEIVLCSPPDRSGNIAPAVLYTARLCGVTRIIKAGGAQAIGAMAYGTASVPKVDKIFGPGNQFVTVAKQQVSLYDVAIDMPAGPSEVMVMADGTAIPAFVAADLLSQAEHGADSQSLLVTDSETVAIQTEKEVSAQMEKLSRAGLAARSIENSRIIVLRSRDELIDIANAYAAEHLIVSMDNPWDVADRITAAGSVFLGNYTPESAGDYASGTNHTLPTYGWARAFSGVNLDSFTRKITYQEITEQGLHQLGPIITRMAMAEGLDAHAQAVNIRLQPGTGQEE